MNTSSTPSNSMKKPSAGNSSRKNHHQQQVQHSLEDLQKMLKAKDAELQRVLDKTTDFQNRLDRLTRVLKQQEDAIWWPVHSYINHSWEWSFYFYGSNAERRGTYISLLFYSKDHTTTIITRSHCFKSMVHIIVEQSSGLIFPDSI